MFTVSTFTSIISQLLPEPHAGLLSGILFGVKQSLDPELKQALITTGTLHIVALSGMNITMISDMVIKTLLHIAPRRTAICCALVIIFGFILFVGPSPSVVRAAIMGSLGLVGILLGKSVWSLWSWGIAVILMLIFKPFWIVDLSFQLSALASLGMILFGESTLENKKHLPAGEAGITENGISVTRFPSSAFYPFIHMVRTDLRTTLSAQTFTTPLLFFTFSRLSLISPLTNILIIWTLPILTVLGFVVAIGGYIFLPLGQIAAWISWLFLEYILQIITWTSKIPFASVGG